MKDIKLRTQWDRLNVVGVSIPSALFAFVATVVFLILVYAKSPGLADQSQVALIVIVCSMLVNIPAAFVGTKYMGRIGASDAKSILDKETIISSTLFLIITTVAYVLYAQYPEKVYQDRTAPEGGAAQIGLAWSMLFISIIIVLRAFARGEKQQGVTYLMAPFISIAAVCLGVVWVQVVHLTTDG